MQFGDRHHRAAMNDMSQHKKLRPISIRPTTWSTTVKQSKANSRTNPRLTDISGIDKQTGVLTFARV